MNLNLYLTPHTKINLRCIINQNIRAGSIKFLEGKDFLDKIQKTNHKEKLYIGFHQNLKFLPQKHEQQYE